MLVTTTEEPDTVIQAEHTTFRVSDFLGWQRDGSLILRPKFQRGSIWTESDKSLLVDSVLSGFPVPLVILQEEAGERGMTQKRVVDGQQRLRTLIGFVDIEALDSVETKDRFLYLPPTADADDKGRSFNDFTPAEQRRITNCRISAILIGAEASNAQILEVYDRLNSTGAGLTAQELRYAKRSGPFANLCYELARGNESRWLDWKLFNDQSISRMLDVEFTSDLVLLLLDGVNKTGVKGIDAAYSARKIDRATRLRARDQFRTIMDALQTAYGLPTKPDELRPFRTKAWFYSVFAFTAVELGYLEAKAGRPRTTPAPPTALASNADRLDRALRTAATQFTNARKSDSEIIKAVAGGASDRAARLARVQFLRRNARA